MTEEILVNVTPMETRVAVVENGVTRDIHIQRAASRSIVGNFYSGKVVRVVAGMQAAFVDIGTQRTGIIHVTDIGGAADGRAASGSGRDVAIGACLHDGEKILVQVTRDPIGAKGARLTCELSLSSRYLVFLPRSGHVGVSRLIDDPQERERLQRLLAQGLVAEDMAGTGGYILRTAAQGIGPQDLLADLRFLKRLWADVSRRAGEASRPLLLHEDLALPLRTVRDMAGSEVERIRIDSRDNFIALREFCEKYVPGVSALLEWYDGDRPLFELYGVEEEIQGALQRKVELKSGGYLVIDQTEAMTVIDVNTGSFVGRDHLEQALYRTNLEAAASVARQLRLRNLGGIIIIDFIDMRDGEHRRQVQHCLEQALQRDPARCTIIGMSELGLVQMTRKLTRASLEHVLCEDCPVCAGRGVLKTARTVCYEILREIIRDAKAYDNDKLMVLAARPVVDQLLNMESAHVAEVEGAIGKTISARVEPAYSQEHFDILPH